MNRQSYLSRNYVEKETVKHMWLMGFRGEVLTYVNKGKKYLYSSDRQRNPMWKFGVKK